MGAKEIQKYQKNGKPAHGVMICDVVPRKNTKHGIPRFQRENSSQKMPPSINLCTIND
jgi:hypothetical protein